MKTLSLELNLDTGKFTGKMLQAGRATDSFERNVNHLNTTLGKMDPKISGLTGRLGEFVMVMGNMRSAIENLRFFFTGLASSAVNATAEIEKTFHLLKGMSKADIGVGKIAEATENLEYLMATAKKAPFSLSALSDSFVKFKAGGIDPLAGGFASIVDSAAAFGATDEQLKRAGVAIQQMGAKGVISMEELRQQLAEAIPVAANMMAEGMGVSYEELVKKIESGKLRSGPALEAMFKQMERTYGGAALRMMNTYNGQVSQLKSNLVELAMAFTGFNTDGSTEVGGFYDTLKNVITELNATIGSDSFKQSMADLGSAIGNIVKVGMEVGGVFKDVASHIPILNDVKTLVNLIAIGLTAWAASAIIKGIGGIANSIFTKVAAMKAELAMLKALQAVGQQVKADEDARAAAQVKQAADATRIAKEAEQARKAEARQQRESFQWRKEQAAAEAAAEVGYARQRRSDARLRVQEAEEYRRQLQLTMDKGREQAEANRKVALTGRNDRGHFVSSQERDTAKADYNSGMKARAQAALALAKADKEVAAARTQLDVATQQVSRAETNRAIAEGRAATARKVNLAVEKQMRTALVENARQTNVALTGTKALSASMLTLATAKGRAAAASRVLAASQKALSAGLTAATVAARGFNAVMSLFGGPIGVAVMVALSAIVKIYSDYKNAAEFAANATERLQTRQAEEMGVLQSLIEYNKKYGMETEAHTERLDALIGLTKENTKGMDDASVAALRRANTERLATRAILARAEAEARARAATAAEAADTSALWGGWQMAGEWATSFGGTTSNFASDWFGAKKNANAVKMNDARAEQRKELSLAETFAELGKEYDTPITSLPASASSDTSTSTTTPTGDSETPDKKKLTPAEKALLNMQEATARIREEMGGVGVNAARVKAAIEEGRFADAPADMQKALAEAADELDRIEKAARGAQQLEKMTEEIEGQGRAQELLNAQIKATYEGTSELSTNSAMYRVNLEHAAREAGLTGEAVEKMIDDMVRGEAVTDNLKEQLKLADRLNKTLASNKTAAAQAWAAFNAGANTSDRSAATLEARLKAARATFEGTDEQWVQYEKKEREIFAEEESRRIAERLLQMQAQSNAINLAASGYNAQALAMAEVNKEYADMKLAIEALPDDGKADKQKALDALELWKTDELKKIAGEDPLTKMLQGWSDLAGNLSAGFAGMFDELMGGLLDSEFAFGDFAKKMLKQLLQIIIQAMIAHAVLSSIGASGTVGGQAVGKGGSLIGAMKGMLGAAFGVDTTPAESNHTGGIVGGTGNGRSTVPAGALAALLAPQMKAGDVPAVLQEGEGVFTREQMANLAPVGSMQAPSVKIEIINESGQDMDAQQQGGAKFDGKEWVLGIVMDAVSKPGKMRDGFKGAMAA